MQPFDFAKYDSRICCNFPMQINGHEIVTYFANKSCFIKPRCRTLILNINLTKYMNHSVIFDLLDKLNLSRVRFVILVIVGKMDRTITTELFLRKKLVCIASEDFIIKNCDFDGNEYDIDFRIAERIVNDLTMQRKIYWNSKIVKKTIGARISNFFLSSAKIENQDCKTKLDEQLRYRPFQAINLTGYYHK